jgi:hypothetical protein
VPAKANTPFANSTPVLHTSFFNMAASISHLRLAQAPGITLIITFYKLFNCFFHNLSCVKVLNRNSCKLRVASASIDYLNFLLIENIYLCTTFVAPQTGHYPAYNKNLP